MTRGALIDAIERDRQSGQLREVATLWRSHYQPSSAELDALEVLPLNPGCKTNPKTDEGLEHKARALIFYRKLRPRKPKAPIPSKDEAIRITALKFDLHEGVIRYIVESKDERVSARAKLIDARESPELS